MYRQGVQQLIDGLAETEEFFRAGIVAIDITEDDPYTSDLKQVPLIDSVETTHHSPANPAVVSNSSRPVRAARASPSTPTAGPGPF